MEDASLRASILAIRAGLKSLRFSNEAAVRQGIVLRLLEKMSWPTYDTDIVSPEYALEGRRVDYALCYPPRKPLAFIEVKQVGQSDGADRQLFEYAFHLGVPMAILTDGREWHFFLPAERGDYGERRVYKLDLLERDPAESVARLERYLEYRAVCSGEAIEAARQDYRDVAKERQILATLPDAWQKLVEEQDDLLLELVADKVESLCGFKPAPDAVALFLSETLNRRRAAIEPRPTGSATPQRDAATVSQTGHADRSPVGFVLDGRDFPARNGRDVLIKVLQQLASRDASFLERFAAMPQHGKKRRYVARTREELYPGRPHLASEAYELRPGWWVGVNLSTQGIERVIQMACEVAHVRYGSDLRIHFS